LPCYTVSNSKKKKVAISSPLSHSILRHPCSLETLLFKCLVPASHLRCPPSLALQPSPERVWRLRALLRCWWPREPNGDVPLLRQLPPYRSFARSAIGPPITQFISPARASDNVLHPAIDDISRRACAIVQSCLTGLLSLESPTCGCQRTCFLFVHSPASLQRQRSTLCRDTAAASPHLLRAGTHPSRRLRSGAISPDQQATTNSSGIDIDIR
jgi:hypothetical protein